MGAAPRAGYGVQALQENTERKEQATTMVLEALVTEELRGDDVAMYAFVDFEARARASPQTSSRPPRARTCARCPSV
jgi:hypothetical protein